MNVKDGQPLGSYSQGFPSSPNGTSTVVGECHESDTVYEYFITFFSQKDHDTRDTLDLEGETGAPTDEAELCRDN